MKLRAFRGIPRPPSPFFLTPSSPFLLPAPSLFLQADLMPGRLVRLYQRRGRAPREAIDVDDEVSIITPVIATKRPNPSTTSPSSRSNAHSARKTTSSVRRSPRCAPQRQESRKIATQRPSAKRENATTYQDVWRRSSKRSCVGVAWSCSGGPSQCTPPPRRQCL